MAESKKHIELDVEALRELTSNTDYLVDDGIVIQPRPELTAHCLCPRCFSAENIEATTMGWIGYPDPTLNPNTAWCTGCGWSGMEKDLAPKLNYTIELGVESRRSLSGPGNPFWEHRDGLD